MSSLSDEQARNPVLPSEDIDCKLIYHEWLTTYRNDMIKTEKAGEKLEEQNKNTETPIFIFAILVYFKWVNWIQYKK